MSAIEMRDLDALNRTIANLPGGELGVMLLRASAFGYAEGVAALLRAGADPKYVATDGWTPLLVALLNGHGEVAQSLLAAGADPSVRAPGGASAADLATVIGNPALFERLSSVTAGAAPSQGPIPAAIAGDAEAVRAAVAAGAPIDARDDGGWTALMHASLRGHAAVVRVLLERLADPKVVAADGSSALTAAVLGGDRQIASAVIQAGAPVDAVGERGWRPLVLAISLRDAEMAALLLDRGAQPGSRGREDVPPAQLAAAAGLSDLARRLTSAAPQPPAPAAFAEAIAAGNRRLVEDMLRRRADPSALLPNGLTPAHFAVVANRPEILDALAPHRPSVAGRNGLPDSDGGNIFHTAARVGIGKFALDRLVDLAGNNWRSLAAEADDRGRTPFLISIINGSPFGPWLSGRSPDARVLNQADRDGITPVLAAVIRGNAQAVASLVGSGASLEVGRGRPSLHDIARSQRAWATLAVLPDDRALPDGLVRGASREARRELQRLLAVWGYYRGAQDGVLGATSVAAIRAFMEDREREIEAMVQTGQGGWVRRSINVQGGGQMTRSGEATAVSGNARGWYVTRWQGGTEDRHTFVSFGRAHARDGLVLYTYPDGRKSVLLVGSGGFSDEERLQ